MRIASVIALLVVAAAPAAHAKVSGRPAGRVVRFPTPGVVETTTDLQAQMSNPEVSTIVFEKGDYTLVDPLSLAPTTLFVFRRGGLTLCSASGDPADVSLTTAASSALVLQETRDNAFRGITFRSTAAFGSAVRVNSVTSPSTESFADDTRFERCAFEGFVGVQAAVRAKNLTLTKCRCTVTQAGGAGLLWEDGSGLFVSRSRFTSTGGTATAALFVRGAQTASSEGDRAQRLLLVDNKIEGDFATGFDLADVQDVVVRGNQITFPGPQFLSGPSFAGRVGIVVRRAGASALTRDYDIVRNTVRKSHYALWLLNAATVAGSVNGQRVTPGAVTSNSFRNCGAPIADTRFGDTGGAIRINLQSGGCDVPFRKNDFRGLASPLSAPAVVVLPAGSEDACFREGDGNLVDRGRPLFLGAPTK